MTSLDAPPALAADQRLWRLEDPVGDFPYYNGKPVPISGRQWLFVLLAGAVGFALLVLPIGWLAHPAGAFMAALLFPALPLAALAHVAPGHWRALFGKVGLRELRLMLGFALLNIFVTLGVGIVLSSLIPVTSNAATARLADMDLLARLAFFAKTVPQLFGEEVITLLPFLALMSLFSRRWGVSRQGAIVAAWLISSLGFGLIHLSTYEWNLIQCIVVIGTARLVLTLPWILTKNIWVSTGAHIANDWLLFTMSLLGTSLAGKP